MTIPPDYENPPRAPSRPFLFPTIPAWGFLISLGVVCIFASGKLENQALRDLGAQLNGAGLAILRYTTINKEDKNA